MNTGARVTIVRPPSASSSKPGGGTSSKVVVPTRNFWPGRRIALSAICFSPIQTPFALPMSTTRKPPAPISTFA